MGASKVMIFRATLTACLGLVISSPAAKIADLIPLEKDQGQTWWVDGRLLDQSAHENDFWQCDYDPAKKSWSQTFNLPLSQKIQTIKFSSQK
jgi:hypothetical protein